MPSFLLCMHPVARGLVFVLAAGIILLALALLVLRRRLPWLPFAVGALLLLIAFWLGSYRASPLGFSTGRIPLLSGFRITRPQRPQDFVAPLKVVTLAAGSPMGIDPQLLTGPVSCMWSSSNGGAFDDPASCDTAYTPGRGAAFDFLRLNAHSACGLPPAVGELRISVLP